MFEIVFQHQSFDVLGLLTKRKEAHLPLELLIARGTPYSQVNDEYPSNNKTYCEQVYILNSLHHENA